MSTIERGLIRAYRDSDWLTLCAAARILINLQEGPGMRPLPRGRAFRWRGRQVNRRKIAA